MVNVSIVSHRVYQRVLLGLITLLLCGLALAGCGYKGPLYLPPPPDTIGEQRPQSDAGMPSGAASASDPMVPADPSLEPVPVVIE